MEAQLSASRPPSPSQLLVLLRGVAVWALLIFAGALAWSSYEEYEDTLAQEYRYLESHARFGETQIAGALRSIDLLLQSVIQQLTAAPPSSAIEAQRHQLNLLRQLPEIRLLIITDKYGKVVTVESLADPASAAEVRKFNAAKRDYFTAHRDAKPADQDRYIVSRPFKTITNQYTITVSRAIRDKAGQFAGVVAVSLEPRYFAAMLRQVLPEDPASTATLFNQQGDVIYRLPDPEQNAGRSVANGAGFQSFLHSNQHFTRYMGIASLDQKMRLFAFTKVADSTLGINVSNLLDSVMADWREHLLLKILSFILIATLTLALVWEFQRRLLERKRAEMALQESEAELRELVESSPVPMIIGTPPPDGRVISANRRFSEVFGYHAGDIPDLEAWWTRLYPDPAYRQKARDHWSDALQRMAASGRNSLATPISAELACKDGTRRFAEINITVHSARCLVMINDITDKKCAEDELRRMATTDFLTGLASRRSFISRIDVELARLQRAAEHSVALLMLDLDHFKQINDSRGHATGDELLKHFAATVADELRRIDMAGRLGGEEFGVILPGADLAAAKVFAERLCQRVGNSPLELGGESISFTVSIGVTQLSVADVDSDSVLARADKALYRAKALGRNRVEMATAEV